MSLPKSSNAKTAHGTNPELLLEKILRMKVYDNAYWKEHCFALTATTLLDKATQIAEIGGTFGGARKPTTFICLALKMLQITPEQEIAAAYVSQGEFKYVRALGAFYLRLQARPVDVYRLLEPLYKDYRRLRLKANDSIRVCHVDEFVEQLLTSSYCCDVALPHLPSRAALEQQALLPPRVSPLEAEIDEIGDDNGDGMAATAATTKADGSVSRSAAVSRSRSVSRSPSVSRSVSRSPSPERQRDRSRSPVAATAPKQAFVKGLKKSKFESKPKQQQTHAGNDELQAMNELRAKLGLKPLSGT